VKTEKSLRQSSSSLFIHSFILLLYMQGDDATIRPRGRSYGGGCWLVLVVTKFCIVT
jgi:hypothetical protein